LVEVRLETFELISTWISGHFVPRVLRLASQSGDAAGQETFWFMLGTQLAEVKALRQQALQM
jgi:hypothetical protein